MKKVLNIGIGGKSFVINEDAYNRLNADLDAFQNKIRSGTQTREIMEELEGRIAELISQSVSNQRDVVNIVMVDMVISQLGMPDGSEFSYNNYENYDEGEYRRSERPVRKIYRDIDNKVFGGVCSGLAHYFNVDILLVRVLMIVIFLFGSLGFWIYIILWIAAPAARTATQKCEMYGLPVTAENLRKFYSNM